MLRKIGKWVTMALFFSLVVTAFTAAPARCNFMNEGDYAVKVGTELQYDVTGTECYVSWNFGIFINVTYVNETYAFGNVTDTSDAHNVLPNGDNISLSLFVIRNVTNWDERPDIHNTTVSQLLEHWNETGVLNDHDSGIYNDVSRSTVSINFTIWTPAPPSGGDDVTQNFRIAWDNDTGVLVEYTLVQLSADPQFSGSWSVILSQTNLWGVTTQGVPGYPLEFLLITLATSVCGLYLTKKIRRSTIA